MLVWLSGGLPYHKCLVADCQNQMPVGWLYHKWGRKVNKTQYSGQYSVIGSESAPTFFNYIKITISNGVLSKHFAQMTCNRGHLTLPSNFWEIFSTTDDDGDLFESHLWS